MAKIVELLKENKIKFSQSHLQALLDVEYLEYDSRNDTIYFEEGNPNVQELTPDIKELVSQYFWENTPG